MKPIRILGGGLAGQACALFLAQKGCSVVLFEPHQTPQDKVCGEGILPLGVDVLSRLDPERTWLKLGRPFYGISYQAGSDQAEARFQTGVFGFGISRLHLDSWLREQLAVHPNVHIQPRRILANQVEPSDIWACGVQSALIKMGEPKRARRFGLRFRVQTDRILDHVTVRFFPWGEHYLTPIDDQTISVAFLIHADKPKPLDFEDHIRRFLGSDCHIEKGQARAPIAMAWRRKPAGVLLGDCYRAFDPISGAGMSFALICAERAAQVMGEKVSYQKEIGPVARHFARMTRLLLLLSGRPRLAEWVVCRMAKRPQVFGSLVKTYNQLGGIGPATGFQLARLLI